MPSKRRPSAKRKPARGMAKHKAVELNGKAVPRQLRAQATYEAILEVTGNLLEEVGVDRLSTNLVCQRAGLTPPALYRYFPNKYALLRELGARLMQAQDDAVFEHIAASAASFGTVGQEALKNREILEQVNAITKKFPGGAWVMRALRAVPALSAVRVKSREDVAERLYQRMFKAFPAADRKNLRISATLTVEVMYAATELIINQPELDAARIAAEVAAMVALYRASFGDPLRKSHLPVR